MVGRPSEEPDKSRMRRLFDNLEEIKTKIKQHRGLIVFCDFDGTLSPIVADYKKASIDLGVKSALEYLTKDSNNRLVIISGRQLEDVKSKVGIINADYVGNHGMEWEIDGNYETYNLDSDFYSALESVKALCKGLVHEYPEVIIEDKKISLSIHYRKLIDVDDEKLKKRVYEVLEGSSVHKYLNFIEGKKVIDVRPKVEWNKGKAAAMIKSKHENLLPIAIGDDITDEDLFRQFPEGITIKVGLSEISNANYFVEDIDGVVRFIRLLSSV